MSKGFFFAPSCEVYSRLLWLVHDRGFYCFNGIMKVKQVP